MTFRATKLSNGFHILTYAMPGAQSVALNLIAKVGSRFELAQESGISHFLEHMAFKGTKNRSARQIAEEFDAIGGQFNAYTSREQTVYYAKVLPQNTRTAVDIIADIIQNSLYAEEEIAKEYHVICQEIAATLDSPDDLAFEKLSEVAFKDQAMGRSILGTTQTISAFGTKDLQNYVSKHHHADNMFLAAAGKVDHDEIVKMAEKLFAFNKGYAADCNKALYTGGSSLISKDLEQSNIIIGFESVSYINTKKFYHTQILSLILGGGISSRLFQSIREELGLAYSVGAFNSSYNDTGLFSVYAGTSHENLVKTSEALCHEINKIRESVEERELERAKAQIRAGIIMAEEKSSYKSEEIGKHFSIFGKYDGPEVVLEYVNRTTTADIMKIAQEIFVGKSSLSVVGLDASCINYEKIHELIK